MTALYSKRTPRNKLRSARRAKLRARLVELLGDKCTQCKSCDELEVHHVDGCTWRHSALNAEARLYRYLREHREGVRLAMLCRSCNGAANQWTYGTREEEEPCPF